VAKGDAGGAVSLLIDQIGLAGSARALDSGRGNASRSGHLDDLVAVRRAAAVHPDVTDFVPWLREVVARPSSPDGVTLSTVHRVKGMEWPHVVAFGVDRGAMPHDLAEDIEEERRVLHVAITRATASTRVLADEARPSPFLAELDGTASRSDPRFEPAAASAKPAARVGDTVRLWGGVSGIAIGRTGDQFEVRLETGALMQVRGSDIVAATPPPGRPAPEGGEGAADPALVEALKSWRRETAQRTGMPAYVVFNDRTLDELARRGPQTESELLSVTGIGPKKLDDYGDDILAIVAANDEP
jgi:DNA helicase-2/ATP-dependent DNA helicase PcrA